MKRCPECYEVYDQSENFCDTDGQRLLVDPTLTILESDSAGKESPQPQRDLWLGGIIGLVAGVFISGGVYFASLFWSVSSDPSEGSIYSSQPRQPARSNRTDSTRTTEEASRREAEVDQDSEAETTNDLSVDAKPVPSSTPIAARLNMGPVRTGEQVKEQAENDAVRAILHLTDGTTIQVDAAWQDKQGVWYRRSGLVTFVESYRVKRIMASAEPKATSLGSEAP